MFALDTIHNAVAIAVCSCCKSADRFLRHCCIACTFDNPLSMATDFSAFLFMMLLIRRLVRSNGFLLGRCDKAAPIALRSIIDFLLRNSLDFFGLCNNFVATHSRPIAVQRQTRSCNAQRSNLPRDRARHDLYAAHDSALLPSSKRMGTNCFTQTWPFHTSSMNRAPCECAYRARRRRRLRAEEKYP